MRIHNDNKDSVLSVPSRKKGPLPMNTDVRWEWSLLLLQGDKVIRLSYLMTLEIKVIQLKFSVLTVYSPSYFLVIICFLGIDYRLPTLRLCMCLRSLNVLVLVKIILFIQI